MTPFRWWCQQNKLSPQWDYLIKFLSLDLANWSIYVETEESCCPKWSFSLTLSEIPWRFSSILPNVKISLRLCKIPWQFPDLEKFYFFLTFPWQLWTLELGYYTFKNTVTASRDQWVNSSPPSAAYMRQWIGAALVQIMVCHLFGAKPLSKPMMGYYQLDP